MNERIKELALKAGMKHPVMGEKCYANFSYEKFAKLIIEDCIDCVDGYTKPRTFGTHYEAVEQIKSNFGIE